jgi:TRAP transporter TAXI family solute receptor
MKRRWIAINLIVLSFLVLPLSTSSQPTKVTQRPTSLRWGTSSVGGSVYVMSVAMADFLQKRTGINMSVEAVGGSDANVRAFSRKKVDITMLGSWSTTNGYLGIHQFAKEGKTPLRVLLQGQESLRNIIVRNDSGVKTAADLKGKKFIGIRPASTDLELVTNLMLRLYGIPKESVKILQTPETKEAIEALTIGSVDGAIIQGGVGASNILELAQTTDVTFLSIPDDKMEIMLKELGPAFCKSVLPANTYKGQSKDVQVPSQFMTITIVKDFPEEVAYLFTKLFLENPDELARMHSVGKEWNLKSTLIPPPAPFHPGAIRYFKEKGLWTTTLEKAQAALLSKE